MNSAFDILDNYSSTVFILTLHWFYFVSIVYSFVLGKVKSFVEKQLIFTYFTNRIIKNLEN
jgi:hypothetical protein